MTIYGNYHIDAKLCRMIDSVLDTLPASTYVSRVQIEDRLEEKYGDDIWNGMSAHSSHVRQAITMYVQKEHGYTIRSGRHCMNPVYVRPDVS